VGDVDVMDAARRSVSAIAQAGGCRLVVVSRALFLAFVRAHPKSLHTYLTQAIARLWRVAHFVLADYLGLPRAAQERLPLGPAVNAVNAAALGGTDASPACEWDLKELSVGVHAQALAQAARKVSLAPGQLLYAERAPGDALFLLVQGSTRADAVPWPAGTGVSPPPLPPPALLGAAAFLSRTPRRETVRADQATGATLLAFGPEELDALLAASPQAFVALLLAAAGALAPVIRRFISLGLNRVWLAAGDAAFTRAAPASSLYILISGRVRLLRDGAAGGAAWGAPSPDDFGLYLSGAEEAGRGDTIGEASLLAGGCYDATALCVRDSELVRMSRAAFELITARSPAAAARLLETMARKLTHDGGKGSAPHGGGGPGAVQRRRPDLVTICVLPASGLGASPPGAAESAVGALATSLACALGRFGPTLALDKGGAAARFQDGTVARLASRFYRSKLTGWMAAQEEAYRFILLLAEPGASAWSQMCVSQADCVLVVGRAGDPPTPGPGEAALLWRAGGARRGGRMELALLHASGVPEPRVAACALPVPAGTAAWLDARPLCRTHHHARSGSDVDVARLARHLAGRAVGLLLAGRGARGLAHLGALRALSDAGVPVDVVGGTGAGALVAAAFARGASQRTLLRRCAAMSPFSGAERSLLADATLPLLSFFSGWGLEANIRSALGGAAIEDLWLRFFCVSTNLTRGELQVHERGPAGRAVRAAQTILGLLPPVTDATTGDLLVDGGYLNNYPVDVMRERFGVDTVIVVDADERDTATALRSLAPLDGGISGWRLLWERANPFAPVRDGSSAPRYGTLVSALMAAVMQRQLRQAAREHPIHLHLRPRVSLRGVLTRPDQEAVVRAAYKHSFAAIAEWQQQQARQTGEEAKAGGAALPPESSVTLISAAAATHSAEQRSASGSTIGVVSGALPVAPRPVVSRPLPPTLLIPSPPQSHAAATPAPASSAAMRRAGSSRIGLSESLSVQAGGALPPRTHAASAGAAAAAGASASAGERRNSWGAAAVGTEAGTEGLGGAGTTTSSPPAGAVSQLSARFTGDALASPRVGSGEAPPEVAEALFSRAVSAEDAFYAANRRQQKGGAEEA